MNETIVLFTYENKIQLPKNKRMLIKTSGGNYHVGEFDGMLFVTGINTYLVSDTVITHYAILD